VDENVPLSDDGSVAVVIFGRAGVQDGSEAS